MLRSWIQLSIITVMLLGLYVYTDAYIALLGIVIVIALVIVSLLLLFMLKKNIHIKIHTNWSTYKLDEDVINVYVQNKSVLPITRVKCVLLIQNLLTGENTTKETFVMVPSKGEINVPIYFTSTHIGKLRILVDEVVIYDYLHLFKRTFSLDSEDTTYIIPQETPIQFRKQEMQLGVDSGMHATNTEIKVDGTEMIGIKEYQEGDNAKHIHWKLTNKFNFPIVKEFREPKTERILVLYDHYHVGTAQDINARIEALISLSKSLIHVGYGHEIAWFDSHLRTEEINMLEQLILLQSSILSMNHQNENDQMIVDFIARSLSYYSHIYIVTSEDNQAMKSLEGNDQIIILMYCESTDDRTLEQTNNVIFRAATLQKDLSYLTI